MNWITDNANHLKNHPVFQNRMVRKCIMVLCVVSLLGFSLVYFPFLCFIIAIGKTILYSHVVRTSHRSRISDADIKKSHEISNSWLIYCFTTLSYWLINLILGGIFLVIAKLIVILFVADMTFLKDVDDTTVPIVLFQIVDKTVDKYRNGNTLTTVTSSFEHFSRVTYPKNRLALYRYVMAYISHKMYDKKDTKVESPVDLNKSMMLYDSPKLPPNPILEIKSIAEVKMNHNKKNPSVVRDDIDDLLSNVLTDMNGNKNTEETATGTQFPFYASSSSSPKHKKQPHPENESTERVSGNNSPSDEAVSNSPSDESGSNNSTPRNDDTLQLNVSQVLSDLDRSLDDDDSFE